MPSFTVHPPAAGRTDQETAFVPDAWSWPAFIFGPLWLVWHRQWLSALAYGVLWLAVVVAGVRFGLHPVAVLLVTNVMAFALGLEGNSLRRWKLSRKGRAPVTVIAAGAEQEAAIRYFKAIEPQRQPKAPASVPAVLPRPPAAPPGSSGVIGLFPEKGGW